MRLILEFLDREIFSTACIEFQKNIESEECNRVRSMLLEKESLEDEIQKLDRIDTKFRIPMTAVSDEILEDLHSSNSGNIIPLYSAFKILTIIVCLSC